MLCTEDSGGGFCLIIVASSLLRYDTVDTMTHIRFYPTGREFGTYGFDLFLSTQPSHVTEQTIKQEERYYRPRKARTPAARTARRRPKTVIR